MKTRHQIDQQRTVQQFRRFATEQNPNIRMLLPMADHRWLGAGGCGQPAAARRTRTDALGDGRRSEVAGW